MGDIPFLKGISPSATAADGDIVASIDLPSEELSLLFPPGSLAIETS